LIPLTARLYRGSEKITDDDSDPYVLTLKFTSNRAIGELVSSDDEQTDSVEVLTVSDGTISINEIPISYENIKIFSEPADDNFYTVTFQFTLIPEFTPTDEANFYNTITLK